MKHNVSVPRKDVRGLGAQGRATLVEAKKEGKGTFGPSAYLDQVFVKVKPKKEAQGISSPAPKGPDASETIVSLIAENPEMNASTFYNLLKSKGFSISAPPTSNKEADSASAMPQMTRAGLKKEGAKWEDCVKKVKKKGGADNAYAVCTAALGGQKESGPPDPGKKKDAKGAIKRQSAPPSDARRKETAKVTFRTRSFLEAQVDVKPNKAGTTRYKVVLLEEGMGNFGNAAYYSKEALESGIPVFEGKKIYADHPAESEATERPERSVRDILGHFENIRVQENKAGQAQLCGDVVIMGGPHAQWARELMEHSVNYSKKFPDKEFVGLSINASGDSEELPMQELMKRGVPDGALPKVQEAQSQGIDKATYVSSFTEAVSCDLVTEAGAGGKIMELIENAKEIEGGPGSGPHAGSKRLNDRDAQRDKEKNERQYAKIMKAKNKTESEAQMGKKESEAKEAEDKKQMCSENESHETHESHKDEADSTQGDDQDGDHADAAQDMALFKKMIQKYMGDKNEPSEEEAGIVKEAYEAHKEMGLENEAAESEAVKHLKLAKHIAAKREAKESEDDSAGSAGDKADKKAPPPKKDDGDGDADDSKESKESKEGGMKESAAIQKLKEENAKLQGKLAAFTESEKKGKITSHVEKLCKESKLHQSVTAGFKKLVEGAKSVEEVDKIWTVFQEGYRSKKVGADGVDLSNLTIETEKTSFVESQSGGFDLGACVID